MPGVYYSLINFFIFMTKKNFLPLAQRFAVELFGTFLLSLLVVVAIILGMNIITAVFAGILFAVLYYAVAHLSGAHMNPAITIGAFLINKICWKDALTNIAAQFAGAALAMLVAGAMLGSDGSILAQAGFVFADAFAGVKASVGNTILVGLAELIGMAVFSFGFAALLYGRIEKSMSGFFAGMALLIGLAFATLLGSAGMLNPAVGLAAGHFNAMYILGPIVGAIVGMWMFTLVDYK